MKFNREMKVALGFIAFAILYLIMSSQIDSKNMYASGGVSSKTLPTIYGIVMIVLAIALFITSWLKQRKETPAENKEKKPVTKIKVFGCEVARKPIYLCLSTLLLAFYAFTYTKLGFILAGIIYLGCMIMLLTPQNKRSVKMTIFAWVFSVIFIVALYLLFTKALSMMLPRGILG